MELIIHNTHGKDMRQYNQPTVSEVVVILDLDYVPGERDIVLKTHEGRLRRISELNGAYDPLQYPLLFPYGEYGWHDSIFRIDTDESDAEPIDPMEIELEDPIINLDEETSKNKDKGKSKEVIESDHESEIASDNENSPNVQPKTKKRKRVTIRDFVVYRLQI